MTMSGRSRGIGGIFGRKHSTYGLILPGEIQTIPRRKPRHKKSITWNEDSKDCFIPPSLEKWELPQYESLFNHFITEDGTFRRRLSSSASGSGYDNNDTSSVSDSTTSKSGNSHGGPIKSIQKWFREIVKSLTHHAGEYDLGGDAAVEGIPIDVCEKLRYVHIYF